MDGVPGGITIAKIIGQIGPTLTGPRSHLGEILNREEARRNGTHLLLGDDPSTVGGRPIPEGQRGITPSAEQSTTEVEGKPRHVVRVAVGTNHPHRQPQAPPLFVGKAVRTSAESVTVPNSADPGCRNQSHETRQNVHQNPG